MTSKNFLAEITKFMFSNFKKKFWLWHVFQIKLRNFFLNHCFWCSKHIFIDLPWHMQLDLIGQSDYFITYSRLILAMLKVYATVLLIGRKCITLIGVLIRHNVDFKHTSALYIASVLLKTFFFISFNVHMTFSHCICCHMPRSGICSYQLENERSFF